MNETTTDKRASVTWRALRLCLLLWLISLLGFYGWPLWLRIGTGVIVAVIGADIVLDAAGHLYKRLRHASCI